MNVRKIVLLVPIIFITGCASRYTLMQHPETEHQSFCKHDGMGMIGSTIALVRHSNCVDGLADQGYVVVAGEQN
ncbi:hypothetical protein [Allohahella sp. A8]|mgnify:CR=1 FL=1|uniref:hypothetical protein n=1 Tax=Allohahella sp. A8 TaxID=3141461 RepID=UPI000C0B76E9|nr:hypothetical protein [Hahellaceae bacterium]|tara:strand:- start:9485 stop:9706 length:222 start_codon:yes stop_codon:yes gene_type:complete